jgi:uncharacterized protein YfdQ (DUF2303 family)
MAAISDYKTTVDFEGTPVKSVAELARVAAKPVELHPDTDYAIADANGDVRIEHTNNRPLRLDRLNTTRQIEDLESLISFVDRHADSSSEVYASKQDTKITAIIDGANSNQVTDEYNDRFGYEQFRGVYDLQTTQPWKDWLHASGQLYEQQEFAEFIEDHVDDIVTPAAGDVLEIAQSLQASSGVEFSSSQRLDSGQTRIGYAETIKAKAGQKGELVIPKELTLALQPFEGVTVLNGKQTKVAITARFRYRLRDGQLRLGVKLLNTERVLDLLWGQIVDELRSHVTPSVFIGRP